MIEAEAFSNAARPIDFRDCSIGARGKRRRMYFAGRVGLTLGRRQIAAGNDVGHVAKGYATDLFRIVPTVPRVLKFLVVTLYDLQGERAGAAVTYRICVNALLPTRSAP